MKFIYFGVILSFLTVAILLLTNHWGVAMKIANYIFYALALITLVKLIYVKKN